MIIIKTTDYNISIDSEIIKRAEKTFAAFGLSLSEAINIFLHKSIMINGLPFNVSKDDYQIISPLSEIEYSRPFNNLDEMWKELDI